MAFSITYAQTAFSGIGGNTIKPAMLEADVRASATIVTPFERVRCGNPGGATTPETDNSTGRTWMFFFQGEGPLSAPEIAALDAIVAAYDGVDIVEPSRVRTSATTLTVGDVADGQYIMRNGGSLVGADGAGGAVGDLSPATTVGSSEQDLSRVTLDAGTYRIDCLLFWSCSSTSGGAQIGLDGNVSNIIRYIAIKNTNTSTAPSTSTSTSTTPSGATSCTTAGSTYWTRVTGQFRVTADASYVGFTWKRGGTSGTITNLGCTATFTLCT